MNDQAYRLLSEMESTPEAREKTTEYVATYLRRFLKRRDKVLICFADEGSTVGGIMKKAVIRCEAVPQFLDSDNRWLTMLKTAFITRSDAIIGPPLMILGLAKLAKHMGTPLFARNVLLAGYPTTKWMVDGIQRGLDCRVWGCYDPGFSTVIAGFACQKCWGVHLRTDNFRFRILDECRRDVPAGGRGHLAISPLSDEELLFDTGDVGRLENTGCEWGCEDLRFVDTASSNGIDPALSQIGERMLYWSSVLDCKVVNTGCGLEVELVVFPGEKLPKMPECAKLTVRPWDPETDKPFPHAYVRKKRVFSET